MPPKKEKKAKPVKKEAKKAVPKEPENDSLGFLKMIASDIKDLTFDDKEEVVFTPARMLSYARASIFGGYPAGAIYELHGPNAGGKTALGIEILTSAQLHGHLTAFFDHEKAANDKKWIQALGLNLRGCLYRHKPKDPKRIAFTLEDAAEEVNELCINFHEEKKKGNIPEDKLLYILWDSVAAAVPAAKVAKNAKVGDANYGLTARLMSDWLQTLTALLGDDVAIIFINQERVNVGAKPWEQKFKSFGGESLQFYAHVRVRVAQAGEVKEKVNGEEIIVGRKHRIKIEKNKYGYPAQEGMFYTSNGLGATPLGFDDVRTTFDEALQQGIIYKAGGAWYESDYFTKINGEKKVRSFLMENPNTLQQIKDDIYQMIKNGETKLSSGDDEEDEEEDE